MSDIGSLPQLDQGTKLAFQRTWLAEERTLLAWTRSATTLTTFGFGLYSFLGIGPGRKYVSGLGIITLAVSFFVIGLLSLLAAAIQHHRALQDMKPLYSNTWRQSAAGVISFLIACVGMLMLVLILLRVF